MNKTTKIIIAAVVVIAVVAVIVAVILTNSKPKTNLPKINSAEDLASLIDKIYEGQEEILLPTLETQVIDTSDDMMIKSITGLDNAKNLEYVVASEPMINAQAYSLVLVKVQDGVNADEVAKNMKDNIDTRKWICVSAEKLYATSSGDIVFLVMCDEETAKPIYENFKKLAGTIGQEYEKTEEEIELPPDML